jgi:hypothetical protein
MEFGKRCAVPRKDEMHWPERPQWRCFQTSLYGCDLATAFSMAPMGVGGGGDILPGYPQSQIAATRVGLL